VAHVALYAWAGGESYRHGAEGSDAQLLQVAQSGAAFHDADHKYNCSVLAPATLRFEGAPLRLALSWLA